MTPETRAALALVEAGLPAAHVDRVLAMVGVDSADTAAAVASKVSALATDMPGLFSASPGARPANGVERGAERYGDKTMTELGQDALRLAGIRSKAAEPTPLERGRERARARHGLPTPPGTAA